MVREPYVECCARKYLKSWTSASDRWRRRETGHGLGCHGPLLERALQGLLVAEQEFGNRADDLVLRASRVVEPDLMQRFQVHAEDGLVGRAILLAAKDEL